MCAFKLGLVTTVMVVCDKLKGKKSIKWGIAREGGEAINY